MIGFAYFVGCATTVDPKDFGHFDNWYCLISGDLSAERSENDSMEMSK